MHQIAEGRTKMAEFALKLGPLMMENYGVTKGLPVDPMPGDDSPNPPPHLPH
jgi:hypothetical protein